MFNTCIFTLSHIHFSPMEPLDLSAIDEMLNSTEFTEEEVMGFTSENQFMKLSVDLLIEIGEICTILCNIYPSNKDGKPKMSNRNEAICRGLMTRIRKMQIEILDANQRGSLEPLQIIFRCFSESVINLLYLLKTQSFDEFIIHSLRSEKELLDLISGNIAKRGGSELPIEKRMKRSILHSFKISEFEPDDIDSKDRGTNWVKTSLFKKAQSTGLKEMYLAAFALPSHEVHGNWQDLMRYHLNYNDGKFRAEMKDRTPSPQVIIAAAIFSSHACYGYIDSLIPNSPEKKDIQERVATLVEKCQKLDSLHEEFVQSTGNFGK